MLLIKQKVKNIAEITSDPDKNYKPLTLGGFAIATYKGKLYIKADYLKQLKAAKTISIEQLNDTGVAFLILNSVEHQSRLWLKKSEFDNKLGKEYLSVYLLQLYSPNDEIAILLGQNVGNKVRHELMESQTDQLIGYDFNHEKTYNYKVYSDKKDKAMFWSHRDIVRIIDLKRL